jgi:hypothetical protein
MGANCVEMPSKIAHRMNIFGRFGQAFHHFFLALFGDDADKALAVIEQNSPLVQAAKPVVADLHALVPDTKVAIEQARVQVHAVLTKHFTLVEVDTWIEENFGLSVPQLLASAARYIISKLPAAQGKAGSALNLAIEFALQLVRTA